MNKINTFLSGLLKDTTWKSPAIIAGICLALLIVLESILFAIAIALLKVAITAIGLIAAGRSLWLAYPLIESKVKERSKAA